MRFSVEFSSRAIGLSHLSCWLVLSGWCCKCHWVCFKKDDWRCISLTCLFRFFFVQTMLSRLLLCERKVQLACSFHFFFLFDIDGFQHGCDAKALSSWNVSFTSRRRGSVRLSSLSSGVLLPRGMCCLVHFVSFLLRLIPRAYRIPQAQAIFVRKDTFVLLDRTLLHLVSKVLSSKS